MRRACDSGVKWSLELEMLCHCSRGSERAPVSRVNESMFSSVRWCVLLVIVESGHVSDDTCAHPVVEASVLVGDTDDDDDDDAATSPPHVFPTSLAHCSPSRSLALPGHVT